MESDLGLWNEFSWDCTPNCTADVIEKGGNVHSFLLVTFQGSGWHMTWHQA